MSYDKVLNILGPCSYKQNSCGILYCFWLPTDNTGSVTDIIDVTFDNGKVRDKSWTTRNGNTY